MNNRFDTVPIETDTRILYEKQGKLGGYDFRYEIWNYDGIKAESIIFANADVAGLSDQEIKQVVRQSATVKEGPMTLNRSSGFVFVNFNFE